MSEAGNNKDASVEAGRAFVAACAETVPSVEGVHDAIVARGAHHVAADAGASAYDR